MITLLLLAALAQEAPAPARMVEVDPIRCWWRTSVGAVRVGEPFTIGLTCAVLEAEGVQVVPDESQLADSAIQLNPFEVVSGSHPPDLRSGQRRFFQYEYLVRVINPDVIGQDLALPNLQVHYRVDSRLPGNAAVQGRDLTYLLPTETVRVLSLVPAAANDIRDLSGESFARVETLGVRAGVLEIAAITLVALGSLMVIVSLVGLARGARKKTKAEDLRLSGWRTLHIAEKELAAVAAESERAGWNEDLAGRALAAMRVAAATALGATVTQTDAAADAESTGGRLVTSGPGFLGAVGGAMPGRNRQITLSSAVTAEDIKRELAELPPTASPARRAVLEPFESALATFTAAQYGEKSELDRAALDSALAGVRSVTRRVRTRRIWGRSPVRRSRSRLPLEYQA